MTNIVLRIRMILSTEVDKEQRMTTYKKIISQKSAEWAITNYYKNHLRFHDDAFKMCGLLFRKLDMTVASPVEVWGIFKKDYRKPFNSVVQEITYKITK